MPRSTDIISNKAIRAARAAAMLSNCARKKVGAVICRKGVTLIAAANGTPEGITECVNGGCARCSSKTPSGQQYESCICIHAEQAAVAKAAKNGTTINGAALYCTLRPCLTCLKVCYYSGIASILYEEFIRFTPQVEKAYKLFINSTGLDVSKFSSPRRNEGA